MSNTGRIFFLSIFWIFFSFSVYADGLRPLELSYRFEPLADNHKFSQLVINDIVQDDEGFVWVATDDGLNRYDGQDNVIYRPSQSNDEGLSHFEIKRLAVDRQGVLWVGTDAGLNRYHAQQDKFEPYRINPLTDNHIRALFVDSHDRLWVGSKSGGVDLISADRQSLSHLPVSDSQILSKTLFVHDFIEIQGVIWVASRRGLLRFDEASQSLTLMPATLNKNIMKLKPLPDGKLLLGTTKGLFFFLIGVQGIQAVLPEQLENRQIVAVEPLDDRRFFLGTRNNGLYLLNLGDLSLHHFVSDPADKYALTDNQIGAIYHSRDGLFWIGTNVGIDMFNPGLQRFGHIGTSSDRRQCLAGKIIYAILRDGSNRLWIGAYGQGLNLIDLNSGHCRLITGIDDAAGKFLLKNIISLHQDSQGDVWVGTFSKGVIKYDSKQKQFIRLDALASGVEAPMNIQSVTSDGEGTLWIATYDAGIFRFDMAGGQLSQFMLQQPDNPKLRAKEVNDIAIDSNGELWIAGASSGLWHMSPVTRDYQHIDGIPERLWSVDFDSKGLLWIGTAGQGAFRYDPKTHLSTRYSLETGLLSNAVLNIQEDDQGNMWLFTDHGLSRLETGKNRIRTFVERDGLQADTFTTAGFFDRQTQMLWTGGINGFNRFQPKDITPLTQPQTVRLTRFELAYKPVSVSSAAKETPLSKVIGLTDALSLEYRQNVFAFGFSALEFIAPSQIQYAFKLQGYDDDWNIVGADRRFANYTNIDPGNYVFKVKATNRDGRWSSVESKVAISISPPWWATRTAFVGYVLLGILTVYLVVAIRTKSLSIRAQKLASAVDSRTRELAAEKRKVEQLLDRKHEEFATVSHEFRTPLTLLLGPLAQLLNDIPDPKQRARLGIMQRNGYRLLRMVDQLLNMETFRVKAIDQKQIQNCGRIVRLVSEAFVDMARQKQLELSVVEVCDVNFALIPDALEKILLNLLSNAVKYSGAGGHIYVSSVRTVDDELCIRVSDDGVGIPADKLELVFERYHRVYDSHRERIDGAGIGLALVKSLVEVHGGRINIDSLVGKGTTVEVFLPIADEVTGMDVEFETNSDIVAMELKSITGLREAEHAETAATEISQDEQRPVVLLIEDNPDMSDFIAQAIAEEYRVLTAADGEQGIELAQQQIPDLVISDIMMPHKDGYQVTRELRQNPLTNHIPIILLTAKGDRDSRLKGWDEKADEYLTKPFDVEELKLRLVNLLEIRNILKKSFAETTFTQAPTAEMPQNHIHRQFLERLERTVESIYTETGLSIADFADKMAMSERQLFRKLKSVLDMTPAEYLRRFRLEKAKVLLTEGRSVSYVALEVGFSTQSYFGKCFKAQYGMSPGEFRKDYVVAGQV